MRGYDGEINANRNNLEMIGTVKFFEKNRTRKNKKTIDWRARLLRRNGQKYFRETERG